MTNVIDMNVCMDMTRSPLNVPEVSSTNHCIGNAEGCWMRLRRDFLKASKAIGLIARGLSGRLPGGGRAELALLEPTDLRIIERQLFLHVDD